MKIDLATATPADIDGVWSQALDEYTAAVLRYERKVSLASLQLRPDSYAYGIKQEHLDKMMEAAIKDRHAADERFMTVQRALEAEFDARGGWTRAYKVTNANGHIHSSTHCSTCFPTTEFAWITELSGMDKDEIAKLAGERACTVCYPNAPVELRCQIFTRSEKQTQEYQAAQAAKRAEQEARKAKAAITDVDGSVLRGHMGWEVKTERTARIELTDALLEVKMMYMRATQCDEVENVAHYTKLSVEYGATANRLATAIAAKTGETVEEVTATHQAKADKKLAKFLKDNT